MREYNTLNEVLAAIDAGKLVSFYDNQLQITFDKHYSFEELGLSGYTFEDLLKGTWVIES